MSTLQPGNAEKRGSLGELYGTASADRPGDLLSLTREELTALMQEQGEKPYRGGQIFSWIHQKGACSWAEMTDLPAILRECMKTVLPITEVKTVKLQESKIDGTKKALFALSDENLVESVLMRYRFGSSVCVSSQVGCRMSCAFCASTLSGLERNLTAGEMLAQVYGMEKLIAPEDRVSHVVVMGSGEPMENYDNVIRFFRLLADEKGHHLSYRNMTVSTCGIVPGILRLAEEGIPVNLALSLHAPNDEIRRTLMPIAKQYPLADVLDACRAYFDATGRQLTWEYALIRDVNDRPEHARELAGLLKGFNGTVNLIPVNPVKERGLDAPAKEHVLRFQHILKQEGQEATIRRTLGRDIDGACGQLRRRFTR